MPFLEASSVELWPFAMKHAVLLWNDLPNRSPFCYRWNFIPDLFLQLWFPPEVSCLRISRNFEYSSDLNPLSAKWLSPLKALEISKDHEAFVDW